MDAEGLRVDRAEALRYLGYEGQELDADLERRFDEAVAACERDLRARCVHAVFPVDAARSGADRVALAGCGLVLEGRDIERHLDGACEVALMACTLGAESERALRLRAATSPTDALLYDAAASALVEAAADAEEARIVSDAAARGLRTNFRFSPGFGDLPLAVQPAFLAALDASRRIGLSVTSANLLVPAKSVTAVVGLFAGEPPAGSARSTCASCGLVESCSLRSQGRTCHG
ncbi:vitamin B12 dependent methionine synthase [Gordonibacter massiliensis (ex Traore et al. 2017)]|uniref:Vitamin B12 dependent methionine synthase n=1 Tax=Gordonibacter massiliensis (ex Traore et al. 2017) TaxID=1841863 RepID=A0A842JF65_9ACTN|nr:vitamin B12 dependent methionine synthase [Gordonibacter massiliensis (ex Traore et al. 2017)]MBC2890084.1 vitamin B12 dependent methionine synthase [Gordonibacter massiliensis (ex Traore et al. 2017)]